MAKKKTIKDVEAEEVKTKKAKKAEKEVEEEIEEIEEEVELEEEAEEKPSKKEKKEKKEKAPVDKKPSYLSLVRREMKKVVWPTFGDVCKYSLAVFIFCIVLIAFFIGIDALSSLIKGLFS